MTSPDRVRYEVEALVDRTVLASESNLEAAIAVAQGTGELVLWSQYFRLTSRDGTAVALLDGAQASALECVAYTALGLGRAAINAIRQQVELVLGYTYFKDHPREWEHVCATGDGFMLTGDVKRYHVQVFPGFERRLGVVERAYGKSLGHTYRLLSAHVHGQSEHSAPRNSGSLAGLVLDDAAIASLPLLSEQATLVLSNYLCSLYAREWPELPEEVVVRVHRLLGPRTTAQVFSDS